MELIISIVGLVIAIAALGLSLHSYRRAKATRNVVKSLIVDINELTVELMKVDTDLMVASSRIRDLEKPRPAVKAVVKKEAAKVAKKAVKKTATARPKR